MPPRRGKCTNSCQHSASVSTLHASISSPIPCYPTIKVVILSLYKNISHPLVEDNDFQLKAAHNYDQNSNDCRHLLSLLNQIKGSADNMHNENKNKEKNTSGISQATIVIFSWMKPIL